MSSSSLSKATSTGMSSCKVSGFAGNRATTNRFATPTSLDFQEQTGYETITPESPRRINGPRWPLPVAAERGRRSKPRPLLQRRRLVSGRTPLIERRDGTYVVRLQADLDRLFRRAYGGEGAAARVMPGLATVGTALGQRDLALVQIAAVHLRLPDLPDILTRTALEAEDRLNKRGSAAWDETRHPRTGTPPNPGWFAPHPRGEGRPQPTRTAQGGRGGRRPEVTSDPMAEVRQAVWDARVALLRRIDPDNPHLTYFANPNSRLGKTRSTALMPR